MRFTRCLLAFALFGAAPAQAVVIQINFGGAFERTFSTPAYPNGTGFGGSFTFDTTTPATNVTSNAIGTFARFNGVGTFALGIGPDSFGGTVDLLANDLADGNDNARFFLNLGGGSTFTLAYNFPAGSAVTGATIPTNPAVFSGQATGSISNAQMRGNFGPAFATAAVAAVPEPATWALMIGGFGIVGGAMRRRKNVSTPVAFA